MDVNNYLIINMDDSTVEKFTKEMFNERIKIGRIKDNLGEILGENRDEK